MRYIILVIALVAVSGAFLMPSFSISMVHKIKEKAKGIKAKGCMDILITPGMLLKIKRTKGFVVRLTFFLQFKTRV